MLTKSDLEQIKNYLALYSKKDSQLSPATLPLNVNDKVAILQLNQNKLVTIKDLFEAADLGDITFQDCPMTDYKRWEDEGTLKLNVVYVCNYDKTYPAPADDDTKVMQIYLNGYPFIKDNTKYIYDDNQDKYQKEINHEIYNTLENFENNKADKSDTYTKTEVDNIVDTETTRATNVEGDINTRLQTVEELAEISIGGGDIGIGTAADFESDNPSDLAKVPTISAILGRVDAEPTVGSDKLVKSGGVANMYGSYTENPEYVYVQTDSENKILYGVKADGEFFFGAGCPEQVRKYVEQKISDLSLDEYEDIVAFLQDYLGGDTTLKSVIDNLTNTKVDKVEGKSLINADYASSQSVIYSPEYLQVTTDSEGKILASRDKSGKMVENCDFEVKGELKAPVIKNINDDIDALNQLVGNVDLVDQINKVKSLGTPIALMDYNFQYPNGGKDAKYNFLSVLRKTPSLIYLYYGVTPRDGNALADNYLRVAYCDLTLGEITNPNSWHRAIPLDAIKTPSQRWQEWFSQQVIISVQFDTDASTTRLNIPENDRYAGMFITYNNGSETIIERYGYRTPPEGKTWDDPITPTDSRTWNDIFASDDYWPKIYNRYENENYPYFEDLYGDPLMFACYGGGTIKVPDSEYPYRSFQLAAMPLFQGCAVTHNNIYMWKSKDGIIFEKCKFIDAYRNHDGSQEDWFEKDGTIEPILHGNIIALYTRWRPATEERQIGEEDIDLDGNLITPGHHLFGQDHLYIPAVSHLDYYRDIFFPTYITSGLLATSIKCYTRENNKINEITLPDDFSENGAMLSQYVANNAIIPVQADEQIKFYIIYETTTWAHDLGPHSPNFDYNNNYAYIKIREIKFSI